MKTFYSHSLHAQMKQISRRTASKLYNEGKAIFFHPCKMMFDNVWQHPMKVEKNGWSFAGYNFETICDEFQMFNCDSVRGRNIQFFVQL